MRSKTRFLLLLPALALAFAVIPVSGAGAGIQAQVTGMEPLDQKRIHALYNDGDFDAVVSALEAFVRRSGGYPRADSVFVAKHLAVVYSANPATREKGKYYMYQLLELLPSAKLVDMYVSDEIDRIFEKVREEFMNRQQSFGVRASEIRVPQRAPATQPVPAPAPASAPKSDPSKAASIKPESKSFIVYWIGGATLVAAGVVGYYLYNESAQPKDDVYVVQ